MDSIVNRIDTLTERIKTKLSEYPEIGLILGSGLGNIANSVQNAQVISYQELAGWPTSTVEGHVGKLLIGRLENKIIFVMQGRAHFYEGYSMSQVTIPVRVMQRLGVQLLILTNAAGAINPDFLPGDVMMILDHINLVGMTGLNPLIGPNLSEFGPRFPDMSQVYDRELQAVVRSVARESGINLREGVYICLSGPSFETPADLRFLRLIGADAVGMSTVPEATVARHGGMRVLGISGISNKANLDGQTPTSHAEVLEAGRVLAPKIETIIRGVLRSI